jgi:Uma2 family endonuclease
VQKVSPFRTHAKLQLALGSAMRTWAEGRGEVGTEWRFRIAPPGEIRRPLVPDVSFVSYERLRGLEGYDLEAPPFAPDIAVEIRSPGDRARNLEHKIAVYFAGGASLVVVVDPPVRSIRLHDPSGVRVLRGDDVLAHPAIPGFSLPLPELFAAIDPPR